MITNLSSARLRLRRLLLLFAALVAFITSVAFPLLVWHQELAELESRLSQESNVYADQISKLVQSNPEIWPFLQHQLDALLEPTAYNVAGARIDILDRQQRVVGSWGDPPASPTFHTQALLMDGAESAGRISISVSLQPLLKRTGLATLGGLLLAALIMLTVWRLPVTYLERIFDELERSERELDASREALRMSQKMDAVGRIAGGIAHDFNNILGIIIGNADLLRPRIGDDAKAVKYLDKMLTSSQRAADLTRQLLNFSSTRSSRTVASNINHLVETIDNLIILSVTPEVELVRHLSHDLWLTEVDPGAFEDALLNLIINARDALPGGGRIVIETDNVTLSQEYCSLNPELSPGEYVRLTVSDNGSGISTEDREHIFEPFFSTKPKGKGTGLGLAMVFGFVKRCRGFIQVHSALGTGSTFLLYLPSCEQPKQKLNALDQSPELLPHGNETILAVDDEKELLRLTKTSLQQLGYRVLTAPDAEQALVILSQGPGIDLLFSDVVMPGGLNGYDLAEKATGKIPSLKVLLTSGYTDVRTDAGRHSNYRADLLNKPYSLSQLALSIRAALDKA